MNVNMNTNTENRPCVENGSGGSTPPSVDQSLVTSAATKERISGAALLDELAGVLERYVVLPTHAAESLALWIVHTYAFQLRDVSTYIGIESPEKRCGKTTLLSVLSKLVSRPVPAANISSPAFFRVIEETQPTLLIDEADTFLQGNDELRGIFNAGYTKETAYVMRVANQTSTVASDQTPRSTLARYSCWCPKVLAAIGRLPDTLADRCIVVRMQRKTMWEECQRLRNLDTAGLRERCAQFVQENSERIVAACPQIPDSLNDRAADIWEPLLALADIAGGNWPEAERKAAVSLTASAQEHNSIGSLLFDLFCIFTLNEGQNKSDRLFTRTILERLNWKTDRPWGEMRKGKEVNDLWLARQLRPYGIRPRSIWIGGIQGKGYVWEDFEEVFRRYVPRSEVEAFTKESLTPSASKERTQEAAAPKAQRKPKLSVLKDDEEDEEDEEWE
jgi:Protein of unknown function (DUF3631)